VFGSTSNLEQVLREKNIVSEEQLARALAMSDQEGVSLQQSLMALNVLSESELQDILNDLLQVRFLKLEDIEIDHEALRHIPAAVAHRYQLIPVRRSGNTLAVAMVDPTNSEALAAMKAVTDFEIIPFVSRYDAIEHALFLHYGEPPAETTDDGGEMRRGLPVQGTSDVERTSHVGRGVTLNRRQTFAAFIEDAGNQFPLNIAKSIAGGQNEEGYNPFLCWGPAGCGKTHLLHAIGNYIAAKTPLKRVIVTTGRRFADSLYESIRDKKTNFFRYLHRELDALIIDDAEPLLDHEWTQQELVETLGHLERKGKQLVLATRMNMALDPRVTMDFKHMLESGVIAGFSTYSTEAKCAILKAWAASAPVGNEIFMRIAEQCGDNVNDLLRTLEQIVVIATRGEQDLTADVVEDILKLCRVTLPAEHLRTPMTPPGANANPTTTA
jgi:chromosomal replication initiation ATPase DnaA